MAVYPRTGDSEVPAQPNFPALEREVLEYWDAHDTFRESIRQRMGAADASSSSTTGRRSPTGCRTTVT